MKGFGIEIKNDLLDPKHIEAMGVAVWLYMWFIDKMTSINEEGVGLVLGGKPIKYQEVKDEMGLTERTYSRWVSILVKEEYVNAKRTPYGIIFSVNRAFKRFGKRTAINGVSEEPESRQKRRITRPKVAHLPATYGVSNKTVSVDSTEDISVRVAETATAPAEDTPGGYARRFFEGEQAIVIEVGNWALGRGYDKQTVVRELLKFKNYWTEPSKSGKKDRWEIQPTFEVKRRLLTWLTRATERSDIRRSGAGVTIN